MIAPTAQAASNESVDAAIKKAVAFLYSKQAGDNWENVDKTREDQNTGETAICTYALLVAGETQEGNPKLKSAIEWLKKNDAKGIYALGMRAQVWNLIPHDKDVTVQNAIKKDAALLLEGSRNPKGAGLRGLYHYTTKDLTTYDSSCSQYGVLGMWAMDRAGLEVPDAYWTAVENAWKKNQDASGGWSYSKTDEKHPVTLNMTAAGIATLFITQDYLRSMDGVRCTGNVTNEPIAKGMQWMSDNLPEAAKNNRIVPYGYYGIERIGVASGYKYFGTTDWYKIGSDYFAKFQGPDGSWKSQWGPLADTSFGVLFLCRGRAPVVMNKLQYNVDGKIGNWNQRPRDAANVVKYVAKQMERDLNWQIVNLDVDIDELHDSPIMYIAGSKQELKFSDADKAKLKQFVEEGGMILGHADCGDEKFAKSFRALGSNLFKNGGEFRKLEEDHPIYTRQQFLAKNWKIKPDLYGLSNQVRELMLLIPSTDPGKAWQLADQRSKEDQFQLMSDIFLYAVEGKDLRNKGTTYIVNDDPRVKVTKTVKVARLDAGDNPDPEPGAWRRLASVIHNGFGIGVEPTVVKVEDNSLKDYKFATLTGTGKLKLSDVQQKEIKRFVDAGGTLVVDAAGGDSEYGAAAEELLHTMFGKDADQLGNTLPPDHALFTTTGTPMGDIAFRAFARGRVTRGQLTPTLHGITISNRLAVVFSKEDITSGLVGESVDGIVGYNPDSATRLMRNILLYSIGGAKPIVIPKGPVAAPKPAAPATPKPPATPTTAPAKK